MDSTKRITRSQSDRMLGGVAGGLAAYFGIDPLIVRIIFVVLSLMNGFGTMLYIALWVLVPNEDSATDARGNVQVAVSEMQAAIEQLVARVRAAFTR
ncbi:PspC domain-containing protein [Oscillochloris sp. ZM17-4]|uniref:PspC domain-containing protein n=1 Tax=Oscillochloris sp. ZM17-4 TaxID=2866714 RepID=UPI001C73DDFF|nr:PspC domain-containing protein [Oscillochloris sp. ZM17-4]MBX0327400.1 PspC domain-containing protein [Oscillochloris sp. ZM17-4]